MDSSFTSIDPQDKALTSVFGLRRTYTMINGQPTETPASFRLPYTIKIDESGCFVFEKKSSVSTTHVNRNDVPPSIIPFSSFESPKSGNKRLGNQVEETGAASKKQEK